MYLRQVKRLIEISANSPSKTEALQKQLSESGFTIRVEDVVAGVHVSDEINGTPI